MKLKTLTIEGKTYAEVLDGKPVYEADGRDIAFDAVGTADTIKRLNGEAKGHRERAEAAEAKLKPFESITDPAAALKALDTVKNLDDKKLVEAGEVEKVKSAAIKAVEDQYKPIVEERDKLRTEIHAEKIGGSFARSKFISDKIAVPADIIQARFGSNFKLEEGKIVAYDPSGNKLYSKASPGNAADFDEALELLVDAYPYKDQILKGTGGSGTGKQPGTGGTGNGSKTMSRKEFDALAPIERNAKMAAGVEVVDG